MRPAASGKGHVATDGSGLAIPRTRSDWVASVLPWAASLEVSGS